MLKLLGALLLTLAGAAAGCLQSHKLRERRERLRCFLQFLTAAQTEIRYAAIPVEEIVARHGTQLDFLDAYRQALARGEPFVQAWAKAAQSPLLTPEDARLVGDFGQDFGATDALGQQAHCSLYAELTRKLLSAAEEDYTRKGRLYRLLGLCGGAVLALLVL